MSVQHEPQVPDHATSRPALHHGEDLDLLAIELVGCPECDQPAEILRRFVLESTDGPLEHVRIRCLVGHGYFMPVELLNDQHLA